MTLGAVLGSLVLFGGSIPSLLMLGKWSRHRATRADGTLDGVRQQLWYQLASLAVAVTSVALTAWLGTSMLHLGQLDAPAKDLGWLGFAPTESWAQVGLTFCVVPGLVTTVVVSLQVVRGQPVDPRRLPWAFAWAIVFSVFNALTEELIFRASVVQVLRGQVSDGAVALVCAAAFGVPHYFGTPGKLPGVLLAGFLGWVLARSMLDTGGLGWAWLIHFAQDVPIITMLLVVAGRQRLHILRPERA